MSIKKRFDKISLGVVTANTKEGVFVLHIYVSPGVLKVNKDFILDYIKHNSNDAHFVGHDTDLRAKVSQDASAYTYNIASGVVFVKNTKSGVVFEGEKIPPKEFKVPCNRNIHFNLMTKGTSRINPLSIKKQKSRGC